ncbi:MAG: alpha-ketoacid dehydrogenase subunit beta [bacterium]|nr:alpha-ketoacid dehydrogenase subunit beta [bacterium]
MREILYKDALVEAMQEEMKRDDRVLVMGEDVAIYGGAYGATKGLYEQFGEERVRDTAISESAIVGAAIGAAITGMRPIAEIMYIDFITQAMDQLVNQAAKMRYMFGGKTTVPMVLRTEGGAGRCIAAHHSQSLEAWIMHVPGLYLVMPSTPYDAKGLLKASIRDDNPVVFIEHKMLYAMKGEVPETDYIIPLGVADIKKKGSDVTIVAYSRQLHVAMEAAAELEKDNISAEVIDPRTLKPLDLDAILTSVKKTSKLVIVSEGYKTCNVASEIAMLVMEHGFDLLDAPVKRVCAVDVPVPMSPVLEDAAIPNKQNVINAVKEVCQ